MLIHNGFVNPRLLFSLGGESVGVLPRLERPDNLRIGESVCADVGVNRFPVNWNRPKPHRKLCQHPFFHLPKFVNLHKQRRWRQLFQDARIPMKSRYGREWSRNGEGGGELDHFVFTRERTVWKGCATSRGSV